MNRWWILSIVLLALFLAELSFPSERSLFSVAVPLLTAWLFAVVVLGERAMLGLTLIVGLGGELLSTAPPGSILIPLGIAVWLLRSLEKTVLASTTWESRLVLLFIGGLSFSLGSQLFWLVGWFSGLLETFPASAGRAALGIAVETVSIAIFGLLFSRVLDFGNWKLFRISDLEFRIFKRL